MKLASWIIHYWSRHTDKVDRLFAKTGFTFFTFLPKLKYECLYLVRRLIAWMYGYPSPEHPEFIKAATDYKKER